MDMNGSNVDITRLITAASEQAVEGVANCTSGAKQFAVIVEAGSGDTMDVTVEFYGSVDGGENYDDDTFHAVEIADVESDGKVVTSFRTDDRYSQVKARISVLEGGNEDTRTVNVVMSQ